ncbi:cell adhesion molecule CEACAM5-like [Rhinoraja longicauda]
MSGCRLTALLVFLFILTGGSLGFMVVPEPSNLIVGVGSDAIFTVRPSAAISSGTWVFKGPPFITWVGTSSVIMPEYSSRVSISLTTGTLTLKRVTEGDSGDYRVTVNEEGPNTPATATVKLLALEVIDNPTITANDSSPVEFLDAVLLTCDVTWKADRFEWYHWNKTIGLIDRAAPGLGNKTLTVSGVLRSDEGFTCLASNVNNTRTSDPYDLGAVYGPDSVSVTVSPERTMHAIGASVTFTCSVVANHPLDFHWYHGNLTVQSAGQKLTVAPLFLNHAGNYTCSASSGRTYKDGLASRSIVVIEPVSQPVVTTNDTRPVEHSDTVVLQCFALGTSVSYQWSRNGATISPGGRLVLNNDNRTLTISGVLRTDQEFTCTGYNPVSTNTSNPLLLNVSYGPENLKISVIPEQAAHTTGSEASLTCSAVSNPAPEYQWLFNGLYQASGQQLVLPALDTNDAGSYTCQAFNNETQRSSATTQNIAVEGKT